MNWTAWIHMLEVVQFFIAKLAGDMMWQSGLEPFGETPFRVPETKWLFSNTKINYFPGSEITAVSHWIWTLQCLAVSCTLGLELFLGVRGAEAVPVCAGATDLGTTQRRQTEHGPTKDQAPHGTAWQRFWKIVVSRDVLGDIGRYWEILGDIGSMRRVQSW